MPFPPSVDVTSLVVLFLVPTVVPVTGRLKVQLVFAARDPAVKEIELGAVVVNEPLQTAVGPLEVMVRPEGKVSVKLIPVRGLSWFGLVMVKVKVAVSPVKIEDGEKDLAILAGAITSKGSVA